MELLFSGEIHHIDVGRRRHGLYINEIGADDGQDRARQAFGINYARLGSVKAKYDPGNMSV